MQHAAGPRKVTLRAVDLLACHLCSPELSLYLYLVQPVKAIVSRIRLSIMSIFSPCQTNPQGLYADVCATASACACSKPADTQDQVPKEFFKERERERLRERERDRHRDKDRESERERERGRASERGNSICLLPKKKRRAKPLNGRSVSVRN